MRSPRILTIVLLSGLSGAASAREPDQGEAIARDATSKLCASQQDPSALRELLCNDSSLLSKGEVSFSAATKDEVSFSAATWMVPYVGDDPWKLSSAATMVSLLRPFGSYDSHKHFYPAARQEYLRWHADALHLAVVSKAEAATDLEASKESAQQALLFEAFAVHYLIDLFSADHAAPPVQQVHASVLTRNRSALAQAGLRTADTRWYFGDGHFTDFQRVSIVAAVSQSLEEVVLASNETLTTRAELRVPFFGWNTASEETVRTGRRSEYLAISLSSRLSGSGVRYAQLGLRLDVWLCRFFSAAVAGYPIYRETRFGGFDADIDMSIRAPRLVATGALRIPLFSVRNLLLGLDGDIVAESSMLCDTYGSFTCHALPEFGGGPDIFFHRPLRTAALLASLRLGVGHPTSGSYGFQAAIGTGIAY